MSTLTVILFLQNFVTRRPRLHRWIRIGFLSWTLVWLGWYAGAQLTVVNVIADIHSLVTDSGWDFVLVDPLIAILSVFTLAGLFLWGRALFCGWLCPFGALQELVSMAARRLRVRQISIPVALHERLIAVKYLLFLGLVAASFFSWDLAMSGAEVEPFKTAIVLRFVTEWPMVSYALALTAASIFVERVLLSIHVPARRRPLNFRPGAHVQLAEAASGMRHAMPDLRDPLPGRRYQAQRRDRHERMLLLPRLPSHLLRRPDLPAHDRPPQAPHRTATSDRQHCRPFDWYPTSGAEALNV